MKLKNLAILGLSLSLAQFAVAQDLESILDEGSKASKIVKSPAASVKTTPLAQAMKKVIGTPNSEQNIFLRNIENAEWEKATLQFSNAFEGTSFQKSSNGRALMGYAQFMAGLPVTGVQTLFMANNPKEINTTLREEWQKAAPADHFAWTLAQIQWEQAWETVFGEATELRVKTAEALSSNKNLEQLQKLSAQAPANSKEKALIDWQLVIAYSLNDQADRAAKLLASLMKTSYPPVSKDLMQITAARLLFQNGYFDASIKYYEKVAKDSDYWTESQEEIGWAYIRKGEPNNAMAVSRSLVTSALNNQVSPEAFFVNSLSQLKVCDYSGVTETLQAFPKRFKERTKALEAMSKEPATDDVNNGIALLKSKKIEVQDLGKTAKNLPRRFAHDERLFQFAQAQKHLEDEAAVAEKLYAKSLALTGLQGSFEKLKQNTLQRSQMAKTAAYGRVKELAKTEVEETKEILRKLHIVEAELIQQVSIADKIAKNAKGNDSKKGVTGYKGVAETVSFPADDEVWFDELSNYRVDVKKACTVKR
ncbi:tetratricopeptide repeat protein [Bdellovibrio sp. HCB337]|uniref:tetratricopeptide repeat protein n=1 Tax=Bdellovibrio sp. HCB337 TaxID=3394358 RepID=UPI0039A66A47